MAVFKKMLANLGVGAAEVETTLKSADVRPGGVVEGKIEVQGGEVDQDIQEIRVELVARVEFEVGDSEGETDMSLARKTLTSEFELDDDDKKHLSFQLEVPYETPITSVFGRHLRGMHVGVRTVLAVEAGIDQTDLDPVNVQALPAQQAFLDAIDGLGFQFSRADVEQGKLRGMPQSLPFYQEIEFRPSGEYARAVNQVEVTFVATSQKLEIVVEADKRGGIITEGSDTFGHFTVDYDSIDKGALADQLRGWLDEVGRSRGFL